MRVLVLDDKRQERESVAMALQKASCTVEAVVEPKCAVTALAREPAQVVVISWPSTGGADIMRLLRGADASGQAYVVALLDPPAKMGEVPALMAAGVHDFLRRPFHGEELVARVQGSTRMLKWARLVAGSGVFDLAAGVDMARLDAWRRLGPLVAEDLAQLVGRELEAIEGWPKNFGQRVRGATIPMSMASDQTEVRVSIVVDPSSATWLASTILGDPAPADDVLEDVLREMANTAGGAVKRAALPDNVVMTAGIPVNDNKVEQKGSGVRSWAVDLDGGKAGIAIVGAIRNRDIQRISAVRLREGMVLVHDFAKRVRRPPRRGGLALDEHHGSEALASARLSGSDSWWTSLVRRERVVRAIRATGRSREPSARQRRGRSRASRRYRALCSSWQSLHARRAVSRSPRAAASAPLWEIASQLAYAGGAIPPTRLNPRSRRAMSPPPSSRATWCPSSTPGEGNPADLRRRMISRRRPWRPAPPPPVRPHPVRASTRRSQRPRRRPGPTRTSPALPPSAGACRYAFDTAVGRAWPRTASSGGRR